jgi:hypothetical protein
LEHHDNREDYGGPTQQLLQKERYLDGDSLTMFQRADCFAQKAIAQIDQQEQKNGSAQAGQ